MRANIFRFISILIAVTFLCQNMAWSAPIQAPSTISYQPLANLFIPEQYGRVEESVICKLSTVNSPKSPMVILIKDAHCHYEAQRNIAKILDILIKDYGIDLVGVEGAGGKVDPSVIAGSPDAKKRKEVADKYLKKGWLTASEVLAMEKGKDYGFSIYGVEDLRLYLNDLKAFRDVYSGSGVAERFIEIAENLVSSLKNKLYAEDVLDFDKKIKEYKENKLPLTELIKYLYSIDKAGFMRYPNLRLVLKAILLEEAIDFNKVEKERSALIRECEKKLPKEELEQLVQKSLLYKLGKISSLEYYGYLGSLIISCQPKDVNLRKYVRLTKLHSNIDENRLFKGIDALIEDIYRKYITDETAWRLHTIDEQIYLLHKLSRLEITRGELNEYRQSGLAINNIKEFLKIQGCINNITVPNELNDESFLKEAGDFYRYPDEFYKYALERDSAIIENLIAKMRATNKEKAVLVIGGFHADGAERLLNEKGIQVVTITPSITKEDPEAKRVYLERMMDSRIQPEKMLSEIGANNLAAPVATGVECPWWKPYKINVERIENESLRGIIKTSRSAEEAAEKIRGLTGDKRQKAIDEFLNVIQGQSCEEVVRRILKKATGEGLSTSSPDRFGQGEDVGTDHTGSGGLIGKYEMVEGFEPEFDQQKGVIKLKVRDIFKPDEPPKEISLRAKKIEIDKEELKRVLAEGNSDVVNRIIDWFEKDFKGTVVVLEDGANEGILGFGSKDIIGLNAGLRNKSLAWFHEIAHSAINNGIITADDILSSLDDKGKSWYEKHLEKGFRDNLKDHYCIRALQRIVFPERDKKLTDVIQKLLLTGLFIPNSPVLSDARGEAVVKNSEGEIKVFENGGLNEAFRQYLEGEDFEIDSAYYFEPGDLGVVGELAEDMKKKVRFYEVTDTNGNKYIIQINLLTKKIVNVAVQYEGGYYIFISGIEAIVQKKWRRSKALKNQANTSGEYLYTAAFTREDVTAMTDAITTNPILRYLYKNVFDRYSALRLAGGLFVCDKLHAGAYYIRWLNLILWQGIGAPSNGTIGHETMHHIFNNRRELYERERFGISHRHKNLLKFLARHPLYGGRKVQPESSSRDYAARSELSYSDPQRWELEGIEAIDEMFAFLVGAIIDRQIEIWDGSYDYIRYGDIKFLVELGLLPKDYFPKEILFYFGNDEIVSYGFYDLIEELYMTRIEDEGKEISERLKRIVDREFSRGEGCNRDLVYAIGDFLRRKGHHILADEVFKGLLQSGEGLKVGMQMACLIQLSGKGGRIYTSDYTYGLFTSYDNLVQFLEFAKGLSPFSFSLSIGSLDWMSDKKIGDWLKGEAIEIIKRKIEEYERLPLEGMDLDQLKLLYREKERLLSLYRLFYMYKEEKSLKVEMEGLLDKIFERFGDTSVDDVLAKEREREMEQRRQRNVEVGVSVDWTKVLKRAYEMLGGVVSGENILSVVLGGLIIAFPLKAFALGKYLTFAYISTGYLNILMIVLVVITFGAIIFLVVAAKPEAPLAKRLVISPEEEDRVCNLLLEGKTEELGGDFVEELDELEQRGRIRFERINIGEPVLAWETVPGFPNSTLPIQGERPWADLEKLKPGAVLRITIQSSESLQEVRLLCLDKVFVRNNGQYKEILIKGKERDFSFTYALSRVPGDRGRIVYQEPFLKDGGISTTSFTVEALAEVHAPDRFGQGEDVGTDHTGSGGLRGARKNIVDTDHVQIGDEDLRSVIESAKEVGRIEERPYGHIVYYSSSELKQTNKLKKTGGGYNCVLDGKTYVFVDLDAKDKGIAEEHEVFEIYWENWIRQNKPDLHGMDITRAAHILAWGQQIIERGWTSASECSFIIEQLEGMTLEQLENIINEDNEDREEHKKIQRILLEVEGIEESDLEVIKQFEASVRELAKERHLERERLFRGVPIPVGVREVAPFSDKEEAEKKLAEIKGIREEGKPVNNTVLQDLYRLACTFTGVKGLDEDIRNELYKWVMSCTDERVIASIIVGWALVKDGQGRTWGQLRDRLRERYGRGKGGAIRMLYDMAKKSVYRGFTLGSIARRGPPPSYEEQLKNRNIYGHVEGEWVNRDNIPNRVRTINVKGLKAWLMGHLHEKTGGEGKVVSIIPYGSYLYGFRTTPSDLDVLVIVDEVSTDKLPKKIKGEVSIDDTTRRLLFNQAEYVRSTTSADVTFITVEQLLGTAQTVTKVINAGIVLQGEGLVDFYVGPSPKINCLAWAEQLATEGRRLATEITEEIDTSVWRAKSMRRLLEANLLIYRIDPSVAVPQEKVDAVIGDVVKYLDGGVKLDRINEELIELHGLISRALIHARISVVWQNLEELRAKREHAGGPRGPIKIIPLSPEELTPGTARGTGEGLQGPQEPAIETEDMGKAVMGKEEIHIISKVIVEKVREKFESIKEYSIYQGALKNYWSQFVFMLEDFIKKQGVGLDEESLLVRKVAERIETMLELKHGEIIVSFTKEEFGAIKEQIVDEIGRQKDERAAEKERREGERRKKEECWKDNKEEIKRQVGSFIKYLEDKEGRLVDEIYEKFKVIPAMESDSPETIKGWIHEILGSIRKQISKDLETFVGGGDWSNAGVFHSLIELYYYNDGTIPIPEVINKCIERVAIGIELEKGLEAGTIVEPSSDNIGKGVIFRKSGDKLIIRLPDGKKVEVEIRGLTTGIDSLKENLKEKVRQLNASELGEDFIKMFNNLRVMVFTGTPETQAAGAFASVDENGVVSLDEVLLETEAGDMVIIHEVIHAFLKRISGKDLKARIESCPMAGKIRKKAGDDPALLRHYYARYYLQNPKDKNYDGSENRRLTEAIRDIILSKRNIILSKEIINIFGLSEEDIEGSGIREKVKKIATLGGNGIGRFRLLLEAIKIINVYLYLKEMGTERKIKSIVTACDVILGNVEWLKASIWGDLVSLYPDTPDKIKKRIHYILNTFSPPPVPREEEPKRDLVTLEEWREGIKKKLGRELTLEDILGALEGIDFFENKRVGYSRKKLEEVARKLDLKPGQRYLHVGASCSWVVIVLTLYGVKCTYLDVGDITLGCLMAEFRGAFDKLSISYNLNEPIDFRFLNIDGGLPKIEERWSDTKKELLLKLHKEFQDNDKNSFDAISMFHVFFEFKGELGPCIKNLLMLIKDGGTIWFTPRTTALDNWRSVLQTSPKLSDLVLEFRGIAGDSISIEGPSEGDITDEYCEKYGIEDRGNYPEPDNKDENPFRGYNFGYKVIKRSRVTAVEKEGDGAIEELARLLGLKEAEVEDILNQGETPPELLKTLRELLIKDIKGEDELRSRLQIIFESAEKVVRILNMVKGGLPEGIRANLSKIQEALTIYLAVNEMRRRKEDLEMPKFLRELSSQLKALAPDKGFDPDMIDNLMEEIRNADGYYAEPGPDGNLKVSPSPYFLQMVDWIGAVFGEGLNGSLEKLNRYKYAKVLARSKFNVSDDGIVTSSEQVHKVVVNYSGRGPVEALKTLVEVIARYVASKEEILDWFKGEELKVVSGGLKNLTGRDELYSKIPALPEGNLSEIAEAINNIPAEDVEGGNVYYLGSGGYRGIVKAGPIDRLDTEICDTTEVKERGVLSKFMRVLGRDYLLLSKKPRQFISALYGIKQMEVELDKMLGDKPKWQDDIPLIVEAKTLVGRNVQANNNGTYTIQPNGEGAVWLIRERAESRMLEILYSTDSEKEATRLWLLEHGVKVENRMFITEYPTEGKAVCLLSEDTVSGLKIPEGHRVIKCRVDSRPDNRVDSDITDMALASRAAAILSYEKLDENNIKERFRKLYSAYGLSKEKIETYIAQISIKEGIALMIGLPPITPFRIYRDMLKSTEEIVASAA